MERDNGRETKKNLTAILLKIVSLNNSCATMGYKELIDYPRRLLDLIVQAENHWNHSCPMANYKVLVMNLSLYGIENFFLPRLRMIGFNSMKDGYPEVFYTNLETIFEKIANAGFKEKVRKIKKTVPSSSILNSVFQSI